MNSDAIGSIVILTGAGISAESGLATFRGPDGLWEGHRVEDVCTPEALARDPLLVHRFYDERRAKLAEVAPNAAHQALAALDAAWAGDLLIVTQNVDDLHERAGARRLVHMHGALNSALCAACGKAAPWSGALSPGTACAGCAAPRLRPDIVFFGEHIHTVDISAAGATAVAVRGTEIVAVGDRAEVEALIVRLYLAWSVLSDPRARDQYQVAQTRTGPPARPSR